MQGKYAVQAFTDKARVADYIREKHTGIIGIFPAIAGFYTNCIAMPHLQPRCGLLDCSRWWLAVRAQSCCSHANVPELAGSNIQPIAVFHD